MEPKVILNYDNLEGLEIRYPQAVIQKNEPRHFKGSMPGYFMADTVIMKNRPGLSSNELCAMARRAAPLATRIIVLGRAIDPSHDTKGTLFTRTAYAQ